MINSKKKLIVILFFIIFFLPSKSIIDVLPISQAIQQRIATGLDRGKQPLGGRDSSGLYGRVPAGDGGTGAVSVGTVGRSS